MTFSSLPGVADLHVLTGAQAGPVPDLLIEVPHGATRTADFEALEAQLHGPRPDGLIDFFYVNTDVGAPELAHAVAELLVVLDPRRSVLVLSSRIPRTFIDCNRVLDAPPEFYKQGGVTPGVPPYLRDPADLALLRDLHGRYNAVTRAAYDAICGSGGRALMLHSYAPRSVDVHVDDQIVPSLRRAYLPEIEPTWPLRPQLDVIARDNEGQLTIPASLADALVDGYAAIGLKAEVGTTYPLHPSTSAWHYAQRYPGQTVCLEVRRDLLADPFSPFVEMNISPDHVARLAPPLTDALLGWLGPSRGASQGS